MCEMIWKWFKILRPKYFRKHPNEHMSIPENQRERAENHRLHNEDPAPINPVVTHDPMSPSLADVVCLPQIGASSIFLSILQS